MSIGLELNGSIKDAVSKLEQKGVRFQGPIVSDEAGSFAFFDDPDGNPLYLAEIKRSYGEKDAGQYEHARR